MIKLIKLTIVDGKDVLLNFENVVLVKVHGEGSIIYTTREETYESLRVKESFEEIEKLVNG